MITYFANGESKLQYPVQFMAVNSHPVYAKV